MLQGLQGYDKKAFGGFEGGRNMISKLYDGLI